MMTSSLSHNIIFFPIMIQTGILKNMYANATEIYYEKISLGTNLDLIYRLGSYMVLPRQFNKECKIFFIYINKKISSIIHFH